MKAWSFNKAIGKNLKANLQQNIRQHKKLYTLNGIVFVCLGIIALISPVVAAEFLDILIGIILFATGMSHVAVSVAAKRHWTYYLTGVVSIIAGTLMIVRPMEGVYALVIIITIFLLIQGCIQILAASLYAPFEGWSWMLLSGVVSVSLPALIYAGWPLSALWFLGILVAINLMVFGLSMIMLTNQLSK